MIQYTIKIELKNSDQESPVISGDLPGIGSSKLPIGFASHANENALALRFLQPNQQFIRF